MTYKELELIIEGLKKQKTLEDYFHLLDRELTEEEKNELAKCEDIDDLHFDLGMWIRNTWVYPDRKRTLQKLLTQHYYDDSLTHLENMMRLECRFYHPDDISSALLRLYKTYLQTKL